MATHRPSGSGETDTRKEGTLLSKLKSRTVAEETWMSLMFGFHQTGHRKKVKCSSPQPLCGKAKAPTVLLWSCQVRSEGNLLCRHCTTQLSCTMENMPQIKFGWIKKGVLKGNKSERKQIKCNIASRDVLDPADTDWSQRSGLVLWNLTDSKKQYLSKHLGFECELGFWA